MKYNQLHVLIIDDHAFTRLLIKEVLLNLGCPTENIHEAEEGSDGLDILKNRPVNLVFCDWQMEPMDGLSFMRTLRDPQKCAKPYIPVIFCSAFTQRDLIEHARDSGVTEILSKPITPNAIEAKIHTILNEPRDFVKSSRYFGPDRRRRDDDRPRSADRRSNS